MIVMAKTLSTRIVNKHDLEVNWLQKSSFVPMQGELIIYDIEVDSAGKTLALPSDRTAPYTYERMKIGDGKTTINNLPFVPSSTDSVAKRVSLSGQCQLSSYRTSVIALCKAPTDANCGGAINSYSIGQLNFARTNSLYAPKVAYISMAGSHGAVNRIATKYLHSTGFDAFEPCTFTYKGVSYGGIKVKVQDAEAANVTFVGETTFNIFGVDIYDSSAKKILNSEVYNSLKYDTVSIEDGWADCGRRLITSAGKISLTGEDGRAHV